MKILIPCVLVLFTFLTAAHGQTAQCSNAGSGLASCTGPANRVLATPNGSPGNVTLRPLVAADFLSLMPALEINMSGPVPALNTFVGAQAAACIAVQTSGYGLCALGACSCNNNVTQDVYKIGAARTVGFIGVSCVNYGAMGQDLKVTLLGSSTGSMNPQTEVATVVVFCNNSQSSSAVAGFGPVTLPARSTYRVLVTPNPPASLFGPGWVAVEVN